MKKLITVTAGLFILQSCIEDFSVDLPIQQTLLVVDAAITDQAKDQSVSLRLNQPAFDANKPKAVLDATVEILINNKDRVRLVDRKKTGDYFLPNGFKPQINTDYKLLIITKEGKKYESSSERLTTTPKIKDLRIEFVPPEKGNGLYIPGYHYIYLDTQDEKGVNNNYYWTWRAWEKQEVCQTCDASLYRFDSRLRVWRCIVFNPFEEKVYDYRCDEPCWDVFYNKELNVLSDVLGEGNEIKNRLIAQVPFLQYSGALVEIVQQCVSQTGFKYMKLLIEQGQNTGTLADTPPAALIGNIKNVDDVREPVGGVFMISGTDVRLVWLDRKDVGKTLAPTLLGGGRSPYYADSGYPLLPTNRCVNSASRTNIRPIGWRD
jgi:hypothetical protein